MSLDDFFSEFGVTAEAGKGDAFEGSEAARGRGELIFRGLSLTETGRDVKPEPPPGGLRDPKPPRRISREHAQNL